jgi:hypothetical protein
MPSRDQEIAIANPEQSSGCASILINERFAICSQQIASFVHQSLSF